jgi:hypothetical protein
VSGTEGVEHRPTIALARADNLTTAKVLGIATSNIPDASFGYVTYWGLVNDVDTSAFSAGDILYLSDTVAGAFTATQPPLNGNYNVELGYVIRVDASLGRILVEINADLAGQAGEASRLTLSIRKGSVGTLNVGEAVYIVGYDNANSVIECEVADNTSSGTMPALGVVSASATNSITGTVVVTGRLEGLNTNSYNVGDGLYVSTAGAITNVKPNGTALVQRIATVVRKNPSNGIIEVLGASRANDLPQMGAQNHIWIGDANNTPVSTLNSTVNLELNTAQTFTNKTLGDALLYTNNSCLNIGVNTADTSIIGVNNFFIGNGSGGNAVANVNTRCNIFIGPNTADTGLISGAQFNVCIGEQNARILTSGSSNITLGEFCCSGSLTTGNENIIIGTSGSVDNNARSNCIAMGTNAQTAAADNSISFNNQTTPFTSFYTQGVRGVAPAGSDHYVTINSSGQFGSVAIGGGGLVDLNSVQTLSNKSFDTINVNNGHTYQLNNQDTLTFEKLRLNNIDVINVTTGTLESAITTSSLQQIASSNNITTFNDTSIRAEHASGTDPYYMLFRKPGNEHYKILLTTTGLLVRDDTSAIPGTPLLRINGNGVNLEQITDAYRIGGVNKLTNTALDATITSAPGLSLSANASHASPQIIENTGAAAELKFDRDSGTYTAAWRLVTTDMRLNIGGTQRIDIDTVSGSFNLSTGGSIDKIAIGPNQVVTTRKTGWATATGTATRTTFDTTTVTTQGLAERLKALIDDLHATAGHGLIGA